MSGSIMGGMLANGFAAQMLRASARSAASLSKWRDAGVELVSTSNTEIVDGAQVIVLGVKPHQLQSVCAELAPVIEDHQLVMSIAAGVKSASLSHWLGGHKAVVRCMPNTPSLLGKGASGLFASDAVSDTQRAYADAIMLSVGIVSWLETEEMLHAVTAVAGSAPAYFFQFMQAMISEGERMGLEADEARRLCAQTCIGAGHMLAKEGADAADLVRAVCSPGGTTERAVASFTDAGLAGIVSAAMQRCQERSREMAEQLS